MSFDMRMRIREQCGLAVIYAEDGAYLSAASILKKLAQEVTEHADRVFLDQEKGLARKLAPSLGRKRPVRAK